MNIENNDDYYLVCWSCDETVSYYDLSCNDGFCPHCNQEIELDDH